MEENASPNGVFQPDGAHSPEALGGDLQLDLEFWPEGIDHQDFPMALWQTHEEGSLHTPAVPPQSIFVQKPHYGAEPPQHVGLGGARQSEVRITTGALPDVGFVQSHSIAVGTDL